MSDIDKLMEEIAAEWDGCMYESVGCEIDIGAALRKSFKRVSALTAALKPEDARLREFAQRIVEGWPEDADVDGFEIQDAAEKFGLIELKSPAPTEPCGEGCMCDQYYAPKDWGRGVQCYRKTKLLTGDADMKEPNA
jgi:hypothetical protein